MLECNNKNEVIFAIVIKMCIMTIIYSDKLSIRFTNKTKDATTKNVRNIEVASINDVSKVVETIRNDGYGYDINLYGYHADAIFEDFSSLHTNIEAAGGVVKNEKSEYLLIKRFGIWDLPKGKVEDGETMLEAAVREVCEETGLGKVTSTDRLPDTYHVYHQKGRWFLKKTYWYLMETQEDIALVPQIKEAISEAIWMKKHEAHIALSKSYRSLFDTLGYLFC